MGRLVVRAAKLAEDTTNVSSVGRAQERSWSAWGRSGQSDDGHGLHDGGVRDQRDVGLIL